MIMGPDDLARSLAIFWADNTGICLNLNDRCSRSRARIHDIDSVTRFAGLSHPEFCHLNLTSRLLTGRIGWSETMCITQNQRLDCLHSQRAVVLVSDESRTDLKKVDNLPIALHVYFNSWGTRVYIRALGVVSSHIDLQLIMIHQT